MGPRLPARHPAIRQPLPIQQLATLRLSRYSRRRRLCKNGATRTSPPIRCYRKYLPALNQNILMKEAGITPHSTAMAGLTNTSPLVRTRTLANLEVWVGGSQRRHDMARFSKLENMATCLPVPTTRVKLVRRAVPSSKGTRTPVRLLSTGSWTTTQNTSNAESSADGC
jgi:hypothetical protein